MWTLLHEYSGWPEPLKAVEAEKRITLQTLVRICRNLVANDALQKIGAYFNRLIEFVIELDLGAWQSRQ